MTDATREQIAKDAEDFIANLRGIDRAAKQWIREAHGVGATRQHPISYAAGLDDALRLIDQYSYGMTKDQWQDLTRKIEALKTEIEK